VIGERSPLAGRSLRDANLRQERGVLVLALRHPDGSFDTNPHPDTVIQRDDVLIAVGTDDDLIKLLDWAR
jgi:voltage-gated potassium channel